VPGRARAPPLRAPHAPALPQVRRQPRLRLRRPRRLPRATTSRSAGSSRSSMPTTRPSVPRRDRARPPLFLLVSLLTRCASRCRRFVIMNLRVARLHLKKCRCRLVLSFSAPLFFSLYGVSFFIQRKNEGSLNQPGSLLPHQPAIIMYRCTH
jgi:hypothetical protein